MFPLIPSKTNQIFLTSLKLLIGILSTCNTKETVCRDSPTRRPTYYVTPMFSLKQNLFLLCYKFVKTWCKYWGRQELTESESPNEQEFLGLKASWRAKPQPLPWASLIKCLDVRQTKKFLYWLLLRFIGWIPSASYFVLASGLTYYSRKKHTVE